MRDAPVLIDLGEDRAAPQIGRAVPAAPHRRRLGASVAVVALVLTAGPAPVVAPISEVRVRVLGSVGGISGDCRSVPYLVVCRRLDASVGVWRI